VRFIEIAKENAQINTYFRHFQNGGDDRGETGGWLQRCFLIGRLEGGENDCIYAKLGADFIRGERISIDDFAWNIYALQAL
jgi:hypothetical protein